MAKRFAEENRSCAPVNVFDDLRGRTAIVSRHALPAGRRNGDRRFFCVYETGTLIYGIFRGREALFNRSHLSGLALHPLSP